jgi:hypothetical protein
MAGQSWFPAIQGLVSLLTGAGQTTQRRGALKVAGQSVFDDGTQTVLGGVQTITGSGTWDGQSGTLQIKGSGARAIVFPNPVAAVAHEGLEVVVTDFAGNANAGTITLSGSSALTITTANGFRRLKWRAANNWQDVS